jgi:hypothetical protein
MKKLIIVKCEERHPSGEKLYKPYFSSKDEFLFIHCTGGLSSIIESCIGDFRPVFESHGIELVHYDGE